MAVNINTFREVLTGASETSIRFQWSEINQLMLDITVTHTQTTEAILRLILMFNGKIPLASGSDLPNLMSPEEMLKSLAIQSLINWTGAKYRSDFERVLVSAQSPALIRIIRFHLNNL